MDLSPQERSRRMRLNMLMAMSYAVAGRSTFTPLSLFSAGEVGAWYDPSDFSTMFQDSAGTTPVTAVEQPVGLLLDKSKSLALSGELLTGTGSVSGGWAYSATNVITRNGATIAGAIATPLATAGKTYLITFTVSNLSGDTFFFRCGSTATGNITANGSYTFRLTATSSGSVFSAAPWNGTAGEVTITLQSIKEIAGNHASQTTSTSRPVLSARVNLLTNTEDFSAASWTKNRASIGQNTTATTDPSGGNTADKIIEDSTASNNHRIYASVQLVSGVAYTYRCYAKAAERTQVLLNVVGVPNSGCYFNLANGTVGTADSGVTGSISNAGNGWYLCTVSFTSGTTGGNGPGISIAVSGSDTYTGDGASGIYVWGADFRVTNSGTTLPPYQRVGAATAGSSSAAGTGDYDTTGFPYYLVFDGTDDFLVTGSIDFSATDKMAAFAGVRKLSDVRGILYELSAAIASNNGAFTALPSYDGGVGNAATWWVGSKGTSLAGAITGTTYASPLSAVHTHTANIGGDSVVLRINGTQVAQDNTTNQGTGNFGSHPLYIGRRGGSSLPFNGRLHGLVVVGRALTSTEITNMETWLNSKTKAF